MPGGDLQWSAAGLPARGTPDFLLQDEITADKRENRISAKDKLLPLVFYALPQSVVKAILNEDP